MPDYQNGKIYTIRSLSNKDLIYVGSTCQKLCARWTDHKNRYHKEKYQNIKLYKIIKEYGLHDFYIELYEEFPCQNKEQLTKREGEITRQIGTLNIVVAGRSQKEHFQENKEVILEKAKKYYYDHRETQLENKKIYYENVVKAKYEENKADILEKRKVKITCECGSTFRKADISQHKLSKKHIKFEEKE